MRTMGREREREGGRGEDEPEWPAGEVAFRSLVKDLTVQGEARQAAMERGGGSSEGERSFGFLGWVGRDGGTGRSGGEGGGIECVWENGTEMQRERDGGLGLGRFSAVGTLRHTRPRSDVGDFSRSDA